MGRRLEVRQILPANAGAMFALLINSMKAATHFCRKPDSIAQCYSIYARCIEGEGIYQEHCANVLRT